MRLAVLPLLLFATATAVAQSPTFAPPVRLKAGDKFLGEGRYFPSPVYHDLNGDKLTDIVVGDLFGQMTVAHRAAGASATFAKEEKVMGADGQVVNLHNW